MTGCRPGEGSRIRLNDIDTDARMFVIRNAKAGKDIHLPITPEIAFAISLAVNAEVKPHHEVKETDLVFPGCRQISQRAALQNPLDALYIEIYDHWLAMTDASAVAA